MKNTIGMRPLNPPLPKSAYNKYLLITFPVKSREHEHCQIQRKFTLDPNWRIHFQKSDPRNSVHFDMPSFALSPSIAVCRSNCGHCLIGYRCNDISTIILQYYPLSLASLLPQMGLRSVRFKYYQEKIGVWIQNAVLSEITWYLLMQTEYLSCD